MIMGDKTVTDDYHNREIRLPSERWRIHHLIRLQPVADMVLGLIAMMSLTTHLYVGRNSLAMALTAMMIPTTQQKVSRKRAAMIAKVSRPYAAGKVQRRSTACVSAVLHPPEYENGDDENGSLGHERNVSSACGTPYPSRNRSSGGGHSASQSGFLRPIWRGYIVMANGRRGVHKVRWWAASVRSMPGL